ncbi:cytochrome P450 [Streptomyces sp. NPDC048172]|uniref:cytochrome P450 n=1 Tax=Streptomyces sp. NPDC048172 TaxID=3365505 RepID=UPI003723B35D
MRQTMEDAADRLVSPIAAAGRADLITEFAAPLAITLISDLVGLERPCRAAFFRWIDRCATPDAHAHVVESLENIRGLLCALVAKKRAAPANDLISRLVTACDEREELDDAEVIATAFLILLTGYEAPTHLIGNGVLSLLRHPDQMRKVREDRTLVAALVEETLRFEGPVETAPTVYATEEMRIGDVTISPGEAVLVSLAGANRDPRKFRDPESFDVQRDATGHLTFGRGVHHCLGAHYSRLFGEIAFRALFRATDEIQADFREDDLRWRNGVIIRGLRSLPVKLPANASSRE